MSGETVSAVTASAQRPRVGRQALIMGAVALAFAFGAFGPMRLGSEFVLRLANEGLLLGLLALSVAFLMSQAGLVALGAASVYGGVGYLFAIGMNAGELSPLAALCVAFAVATIYAAVLGALIVRTNPLAFMMLTLAAGEGEVLRAIRINEERMRFSGFNTYMPRLAGYVFANLIAALCGLLHVLNAGFVSPESLGLSVSTNALVAALIGGTSGSIGPIFGGMLYTFAQDEFGARGFTQLLTGAAIVIFIVAFPSGIVGGIWRGFARWSVSPEQGRR